MELDHLKTDTDFVNYQIEGSQPQGEPTEPLETENSVAIEGFDMPEGMDPEGYTGLVKGIQSAAIEAGIDNCS